MSGECEKCSEHCLDCNCEKRSFTFTEEELRKMIRRHCDRGAVFSLHNQLYSSNFDQNVQRFIDEEMKILKGENER